MRLSNVVDALTPSNIVNFVYSQNPAFLLEQSYAVTQISTTPTDIFQILFSSKSKVILKISNLLYYIILFDIVNSIASSTANFFNSYNNSTLTILSSSKIVGGYQNFTDLNDPIFISIVNHLFS